MRIAAPVADGGAVEHERRSDSAAGSHQSPGVAPPAASTTDHYSQSQVLPPTTPSGFDHLQPCPWQLPGGSGQVVRDPHGVEWAVVLENPSLQGLLAELKALHALRDSGVPEALGLGGAEPMLHVVVSPEALAEIPSVTGIRRWCSVDGRRYPVAD